MSVTLIVVMISWVFEYIQTHQIVYIKFVQFFKYILYTDKLFFNKSAVVI